MTRKRVTASEKKQRHEWAVQQIDAGMGLSELTAFTAETWGRSRRQARDVIPLHCLATLPSAIAVLWSLDEVGSHQDQDAVINCRPVQLVQEINQHRVGGPPVLTAQNSGQAVDADCVVLLCLNGLKEQFNRELALGR